MFCSSTHAPNFLTVNLMLFNDQKKGGRGHILNVYILISVNFHEGCGRSILHPLVLMMGAEPPPL